MPRYLLIFVLLGSSHSGMSSTTTYITRVQHERESTRFTLTEWLRIKERMRLMDVWLAMFSSPKKAQFRPELFLSHSGFEGSLQDDVATSVEGRETRARFYPTNLVSATLGVKTLNIDFGAEASKENLTFSNETTSVTSKKQRLDYGGVLRVLGKHIQDTSLTFSAGRYQLVDPRLDAARKDGVFFGRYQGVGLRAYLGQNIGLYGNGQIYRKASLPGSEASSEGSRGEYGVFLGISVFRLNVGQRSESWLRGDTRERTSGYHAGLDLSL